MTHVGITEHYDAPIERVFELGIDPTRVPEWMPIVHRVKDVTEPFERLGSTYIAEMKLLGRPVEGRVELTELERPKLITYVVTSAVGAKFTWKTLLTEAKGGTDAESIIDYELPAGFFGEVFDKLFVERSITRDLKYSLECFKSLVEMKVLVTA